MNLSEFSTQELKNELIRRIQEKASIRKQSVRCVNCAHRVLGKCVNTVTGNSTWVCEVRPKYMDNYNAAPDYMKRFYACTEEFTNNCALFIHKESDEGQNIMQARNEFVERFLIDID